MAPARMRRNGEIGVALFDDVRHIARRLADPVLNDAEVLEIAVSARLEDIAAALQDRRQRGQPWTASAAASGIGPV
jgi:hypothetical protein